MNREKITVILIKSKYEIHFCKFQVIIRKQINVKPNNNDQAFGIGLGLISKMRYVTFCDILIF